MAPRPDQPGCRWFSPRGCILSTSKTTCAISSACSSLAQAPHPRARATPMGSYETTPRPARDVSGARTDHDPTAASCLNFNFQLARGVSTKRKTRFTGRLHCRAWLLICGGVVGPESTASGGCELPISRVGRFRIPAGQERADGRGRVHLVVLRYARHDASIESRSCKGRVQCRLD